MSRKQSRELAFRLIYGLAFDGGGGTADAEAQMLANDFNVPVDEKEQQYITGLFTAVRDNIAEIDAKIAANVKGFSFDRLFLTDLTVLRLCVGEVLYMGETPKAVAINEAVTLAKKYGTEKSGTYVNGVLASIISDNGEQGAK